MDGATVPARVKANRAPHSEARPVVMRGRVTKTMNSRINRRALIGLLMAAGMALAADKPREDVQVFMTVSALEKKPGKVPAKYHTWADCGLLHPEANRIRMLTEHDAEVHGYTLCARCAKRNSAPVITYEGWTKPVTAEQLRDAQAAIEKESR